MKKVYVNPNYHGNGWFDPKAAMNFFKKDGVITILDGVDCTNIDRYINLTYLLEVKEEPEEVIPQVVVSTAKELLSKNVEEIAPVVTEEPAAAEAKVVVTEEPETKPESVEKPKKRAPKKSTTKK
jgi:hypothetical protein